MRQRRLRCQDQPVPRSTTVPSDLRLLPFRARVAIDAGLLTWSVLRGPAWRRLLPGIYVHAETPLDHRTWCRAAALWGGSTVAISGLSAAYLWGVMYAPRDGIVEATTPDVRRAGSYQVRFVRSPLSVDDVTHVNGIPVTSPTRTAFDIARRCPVTEAVVAIDALMQRRVLRHSDLTLYVESHHRWRGQVQAAHVVGLTEPLSESPMETRLRLVIVDSGLPRPVAQFEVRNSAGRLVGRVDLAYPQWRIAIEYDGDHHRGREEYRDDQRRANALRVAGWTVLRFTASDVWRRPDQIVAQIRALIPA
jgi:very-short-patch-repair endonuclease